MNNILPHLGIAGIAWLTAALLFMMKLGGSEPPMLSLLFAITIQTSCLWYFRRTHRIQAVIAILTGMLVGWSLTPEISGRTGDLVTDLFSNNRLRFGGVTNAIVGGLLLGIIFDAAWFRTE